MHQHSNDPLHLSPAGLIPGDGIAPGELCRDCGEHHPFRGLQNFAGALRCDPCIRAGACKTCRCAMAMPGWDTCPTCEAAFLTANEDEFLDSIPALSRTEEGCAVIRAVLIPKHATVLDIATMATTYARQGQAEIAEVLLRAAVRARRVAA